MDTKFKMRVYLPWDEWKYLKTSQGMHQRVVINCPFHYEKTPSMIVDAFGHKQHYADNIKYHCLSCGANGEYEGVADVGTNTGAAAPQFFEVEMDDNQIGEVIELDKLAKYAFHSSIHN